MQTQQTQTQGNNAMATALATAAIAAVSAPVPATAADVQAASAERDSLKVKIQARGKLDGQKIVDHDLKAEQGKARFFVETLKQAAMDMQAEWQVIEYLAGFREAWPENSRKVRASEAKAFILAYQKAPEEINKHTGTQVALIARCREILGRKTADGNSKPRAPHVTDKGMAGLSEKVKVLNPKQAAVVANEAIAQLVAATPEGWEVALLRQIDGLCTRLGQSKQPHYQKMAESLQKIAGEELNRYAIQQHKAA